jgi:hypothetical protein
MGNDYLPKIQKTWFTLDVTNYDNNLELSRLCLGDNVPSPNIIHYLTWLQWTCDYYQNYKIHYIPSMKSPPEKINWNELKSCRVPQLEFENVDSTLQTIEFQLLYTFPSSKFLPSYLQLFFEKDTLLTPEIAESFTRFWGIFFEKEEKKCQKIYQPSKKITKTIK